MLVNTVNSDDNVKVKRKALAALGEFMFYAFTQLDDDNHDNGWKISDLSIQTLKDNLRFHDDEIIQLYACKAIENISAQARKAGYNFATIEVAKDLLNFYESPDKPNGKVTSIVTISHLCKLNDEIFPFVFQHLTSQKFFQTMIDGSPRIQ